MSSKSSSAVVYSVKKGLALLRVTAPPVNALSQAVRSGLLSGLDKAACDPSAHGVVVFGDGRTFPAGADITEFATGVGPPGFYEVMDAFDAVGKPCVAAIHGTALGGGFELALSCHYRVALSSARVGLPEVHLGLLPGAGGTQRLPRLIGAEQATAMMTSGVPMAAHKALALGAVDAVYEQDLVDQVPSFLEERSGDDLASRRVSGLAVGAVPEGFFDAARAEAGKRMRGLDAPQRIIDCVEAAATEPTFAEGIAREGEHFESLFGKPEANALQHMFFAERVCSKVPGVEAKDAGALDSVAVVGGGTMGQGIVMSLINKGIPTVLLELDAEVLARAVARIEDTYRRSSAFRKGKMSEEDLARRMALVTPTTSYGDLGSVDLAIEAVFEDMAVKHEVFAALDAACKPGAVLASNTSTLSIDEIAAATSRPESVVGMHFFSPAHIMRLLENVRGSESSPAAVATAMAAGKRLGKVTVLAGNCFGFIGNRMLEWYSQEAWAILEDGARPHTVDAALTKTLGLAMGIFAMHDLAGNDVGWRVRQGLGLTDPANRDPAIKYSAALADTLCELGRFGQKTGQGWYKYDPENPRTPIPDPEVDALIDEHFGGAERPAPDASEIIERLLFPLVNEGFKILEDEIALRPGDIDVVWTSGYGWPRHLGGPMHWAETIGLRHVRDRLKSFSRDHPDRPYFEPSALLCALADADARISDWKKHAP